MRRLCGSAAVILAIAACHATPVTPASKPRATAAPVVAATATATPAASTRTVEVKSASATPTVAPTATAPAGPAVGDRLLQPPSGTRAVAGSVLIDASYVVSSNSGRVVSANGTAILAAGRIGLAADGHLVSDSGGAAVALASGNMVSDNGGALIGNNAAGLIGNNAAGLIGNNAGGLVSNNAGSLISNNAGSLTSKTKFGLLDVETAPPAFGAELPAAGVEITVTSLQTGKRLPLGVDSHGVPVYSVYTNLSGGYEVYVPDGEPANVLVQAHVPQTTDPRQSYALVSAGRPEDVMNEDSCLNSRQARVMFGEQFLAYLVNDPATTLCMIDASTNISTAVKSIMMGSLTELHDLSVQHGVADPARREAARALAYRCADAIIARADFDQIPLDATSGVTWGKDPLELPTTASKAVNECFRTVREAAAAKLAADPHFFDQQPYMVEANACNPGYYQIKKPTDINSFLIEEYVTNASDPGYYATNVVLASLGAEKGADGVRLQHKLNVAQDAQIFALVSQFFGNQNGMKDAVYGLIQAFDGTIPADEPAPPVVHSPCPRASMHPLSTTCDAAATSDAAATP